VNTSKRWSRVLQMKILSQQCDQQNQKSSDCGLQRKSYVMKHVICFWKSHFLLSVKTELDKWFSSQTLFLRPVESALKENWTFDQISQHQNHFGHVIKIKKFEGSCTFMVTILLRVLSLIAFSLVWFDEVTSDEISSMVSWSICTYGNL
jgi:hypothetical protein